MIPEDEGLRLAEELRAAQHLGVAPVADLVEFIETTLNIDVALLKMPPKVWGMTQRDPGTGRLIVAVTTQTSPEHQRFTLAHELGHVRAESFSTSLNEAHRHSPSERLADAFAGHFLAPIDGIRALPATTDKFELVSDIVRRFRVSPEVAVIQLSKASPTLSPMEQEKLRSPSAAWYAARYGWDRERADLDRAAKHERSPQRLVANAMEAYQRGLISAAVVARLKFQSEAETVAELRELHINAPAASASARERSRFDVESDW